MKYKIKCPECNSSQLSFYYMRNCTIIYCQSKNCDSIGNQAFLTFHQDHPLFPKIVERIDWNHIPDKSMVLKSKNTKMLDEYLNK